MSEWEMGFIRSVKNEGCGNCGCRSLFFFALLFVHHSGGDVAAGGVTRWR